MKSNYDRPPKKALPCLNGVGSPAPRGHDDASTEESQQVQLVDVDAGSV